MPRSHCLELSSIEFSALKVVWRHRRANTAQIAAALETESLSTPETVEAFLQSMVDRALIRRLPHADSDGFETTLDQEETCIQLLRHAADRTFGGSMRKLVQHFIDNASPTAITTAKAKRLLEMLEE